MTTATKRQSRRDITLRDLRAPTVHTAPTVIPQPGRHISPVSPFQDPPESCRNLAAVPGHAMAGAKVQVVARMRKMGEEHQRHGLVTKRRIRPVVIVAGVQTKNGCSGLGSRLPRRLGRKKGRVGW